MGTKNLMLAPYQTYPTADGYLSAACGNQKVWYELRDAIDRSDLADDPQFATNADQAKRMDELSAVFRGRTTEE